MQQRFPRVFISVIAMFAQNGRQERDDLDGLAQPHVVAQHCARVALVGAVEEFYAHTLVVKQVAVEVRTNLEAVGSVLLGGGQDHRTSVHLSNTTTTVV